MKNIFSACVVTLLAFSSVSFAVNPVSDKPSVTSEKTVAPVVVPVKAITSTKGLMNQEVININSADAQTLINLKGIGPKKAEAIIAWRKANGGFKTVDQFADVKGIGSKTLEVNRKNLRVQ